MDGFDLRIPTPRPPASLRQRIRTLASEHRLCNDGAQGLAYEIQGAMVALTCRCGAGPFTFQMRPLDS